MKIALVYPPTCDPTAPYLAVPMLTGFLRAEGVEVVPVDANVEAYDRLLRPAPLRRARPSGSSSGCAKLDRRAALDHVARRDYLAAVAGARRRAGGARGYRRGARACSRTRRASSSPSDYERAVETIESALRLVSAAYAPLDLTFSGYRTPFALTTPEEIADDARAERDPVRRLRAPTCWCRACARRGVDAIGISVCFPGQLQPAYAFALKLKRLLPEVHLTCGGPGITQLLIRLSGHDLARALGPFDSAVVFEGEHALLGLCRALDEKRPLRGLPNVVHRDPLARRQWAPGRRRRGSARAAGARLRRAAARSLLLAALTLPYDPTRGCYWGKCTFCHYGLAEIGTASYRERGAERTVDHLARSRDKYGTRWFYLSQDSVAPKTLVKIARRSRDAGSTLKWATDLKPEKYLTAERARALCDGGGVACALGVESANPRVLDADRQGRAGRRRCATPSRTSPTPGSPSRPCASPIFRPRPTPRRWTRCASSRSCGDEVALYIVGEFDLTHGALVAKEPARFGIEETWQLDGDLLGTGLFYEEARAVQARRRRRQARRGARSAVGGLAAAALPVGRLAVDGAHRPALRAFGPGVFRERARLAAGAAVRRPRRRGGGALRSRRGRAQRRRRAGDLAPAGARAAPRLARRLPGAGQGAAAAAPAAAPLPVHRRTAAGAVAHRAARSTPAERVQRRRLKEGPARNRRHLSAHASRAPCSIMNGHLAVRAGAKRKRDNPGRCDEWSAQCPTRGLAPKSSSR